ncbi:orotidine-5'-phosphate decarboxylase [Granulicella cerasi]|uniref:Orotidine-5'-phosphate decarboxylase n=1 Tax=Granulicella cerasi TaxID=741063 RepID=A0ABW1Z7E2_9BACT|nr:orotidine-5'-phosphate decarboxylase [Granulicella cerasi]
MNPVLAKYERNGSLLCVGLDPDLAALPESFRAQAEPQLAFNRYVIDATREYAGSYKLNAAFYEARGAQGVREMEQTVEYLRAVAPDAVTICDAKRADIGNTNRGYVESVFDAMGFDAITLHPYLGSEALSPFLDREDKLSIVLCRTSNPGAGELQDLVVNGDPLWKHMARQVAETWNTRGNCALVVGATWPDEMRAIRAVAPELPLLVPGIGAQGGDVKAVVDAGLDARGGGLMIASSRGIIFAQDPHAAATSVYEEIEEARKVTHAR